MSYIDPSVYPLLENIISALKPEDVPSEYIISVRVTDIHGKEHLLKGNQAIDSFFENPASYSAVQARIILNSSKISSDLVKEIDSIYKDVSERLSG